MYFSPLWLLRRLVVGGERLSKQQQISSKVSIGIWWEAAPANVGQKGSTHFFFFFVGEIFVQYWQNVNTGQGIWCKKGGNTAHSKCPSLLSSRIWDWVLYPCIMVRVRWLEVTTSWVPSLRANTEPFPISRFLDYPPWRFYNCFWCWNPFKK